MRIRIKPAVKWFLLLGIAALILVGVTVWPRTKTEAASPVPVRFVEGIFHGFLTIRSSQGDQIASGDLRQVAAADKIKNHMSFRFKDGSVLDETVTFTQDRVFTMRTYHTIQRGPAFPEDLEATLEKSSRKYTVKVRDHKDGEEKKIEGTLDLPANVYNGMILTVLKNLRKGAGDRIRLVSFTPKPELVELALVPAGEEKVSIGGMSKTADAYTLHPDLSGAKKLLAVLADRVPPDGRILVLADEVPTFLKFRGQLFMDGPIWQIELTSPETDRRRETER